MADTDSKGSGDVARRLSAEEGEATGSADTAVARSLFVCDAGSKSGELKIARMAEAEKQPINTRVQMYTTMEPLEAKNVTYKGLICVNKASTRSILLFC